jgi:hypothetical protein
VPGRERNMATHLAKRGCSLPRAEAPANLLLVDRRSIGSRCNTGYDVPAFGIGMNVLARSKCRWSATVVRRECEKAGTEIGTETAVGQAGAQAAIDASVDHEVECPPSTRPITLGATR